MSRGGRAARRIAGRRDQRLRHRRRGRLDRLALQADPRRSPPTSRTGSARARPPRFDISAGCAGFAYGLTLAKGMVVEGSAEYVLVIGVERLSDLTDLEDRATAFLFGDGAARGRGRPVRRSRHDRPRRCWGSEGDKSETIKQTVAWDRFRLGDVSELPSRRGQRQVPGDHPGGPGGLPLGRVRDGEGRPAGAGRGRDHRRTTWTSSSRTRPTCGSSTRW